VPFPQAGSARLLQLRDRVEHEAYGLCMGESDQCDVRRPVCPAGEHGGLDGPKAHLVLQPAIYQSPKFECTKHGPFAIHFNQNRKRGASQSERGTKVEITFNHCPCFRIK
jgi:hypothetical protein